MGIIPDNYSRYELLEAKKAAWIAKRPVCSVCGEKIEDDFAFDDGNGLMCPECWDKRVNDEYLVDVDEYMDSHEEGW